MSGCGCRPQVLQDYEKTPEQVDLRDAAYVKKTADRMPDVGKKVGVPSSRAI